MSQLPALDLRTNVLTLAVAPERLPAVAELMTALLPREPFDPEFAGQELTTAYFDTPSFRLRRARLKGRRYLTLRVRCYEPGPAFALSAKTEDGKLRVALPSDLAASWLQQGLTADALAAWLPGDLVARLFDLAGDDPLLAVVTVGFTRYAVEDEADRLTLDVGIRANTGKVFPVSILEHKTTRRPAAPLPVLLGQGLPPVKLSKFLWATSYGVR